MFISSPTFQGSSPTGREAHSPGSALRVTLEGLLEGAGGKSLAGALCLGMVSALPVRLERAAPVS